MTQKERILAALRFEGSRGIAGCDFSPPHVYDGGKPIYRVAARIMDLREEGYDIVTDGTRHGTGLYKLRQAPHAVESPPIRDSLFPEEKPARSSAYFGEAA
jgi:hypothetical protein